MGNSDKKEGGCAEYFLGDIAEFLPYPNPTF